MLKLKVFAGNPLYKSCSEMNTNTGMAVMKYAMTGENVNINAQIFYSRPGMSCLTVPVSCLFLSMAILCSVLP